MAQSQSVGDGSGMRVLRDVTAAREAVQGINDSTHAHSSFQSVPSGATFQQSFVFGDSAESTEEQETTRLFTIIEQGIPRPNDRLDVEDRIQITEMTYGSVRQWLRNHPGRGQREEAVAVRGNNDTTPLHNICKLDGPPADIIKAFVEALPEVAGWEDAHGWVPLHFACACGASQEVLEILVEAYPDGVTKQDSQDRTPLHFYLTHRFDNPTDMAENIGLLLESGAAEIPDSGGMLPMHYACAYGVCPPVLSLLAQAYPNGLVAREYKGRAPIHLAMVNCHRETGRDTISFLLDSCGTDIVNMRDNAGNLPLHLLSFRFRGNHDPGKEQKSNVIDCLTLYLEAEPIASADFLTAIQDLPDWLQEVAVVAPYVRNVLNRKIIQSTPTIALMLDGYVRILLIVCFEITSMDHIDYRFANDPLNEPQTALSLVYIGASYFLIRELLQIISLWTLGSLTSWFCATTNWLDVAVIVLVFYYAICMTANAVAISDETFRIGLTFTKGVLWISFLSYLKSTLVGFSVFWGGVKYALKRLAAFLIAVSITLLSFALMFFFTYVDTNVCDFTPEGVAAGDECYFPHCTYGNSFLKVYTMMMGEVGNESRYNSSLVAQILYFMYAFLVVILLSNVLIAIVTDSYEVVQNDRAAIVFWSNRLDFVAEMDSISYGVRNRLGIVDRHIGQEQEGTAPDTNRRNHNTSKQGFAATTWKNLMQLFDDHLYQDTDLKPSNVDFWCFLLVRTLVACFILPLWIVAGIVTAGWLWPPQVREWLFAQRETQVSRSDIEKQKRHQLADIQNEIRAIKMEIRKELSVDRDELTRMKNQIEVVQGRIASDLQQVRELMTTLLDMGQGRENLS